MQWKRSTVYITLISEAQGKDPELASLGNRLQQRYPDAVIWHGWLKEHASDVYQLTFNTIEEAEAAIAWLNDPSNGASR